MKSWPTQYTIEDEEVLDKATHSIVFGFGVLLGFGLGISLATIVFLTLIKVAPC